MTAGADRPYDGANANTTSNFAPGSGHHHHGQTGDRGYHVPRAGDYNNNQGGYAKDGYGGASGGNSGNYHGGIAGNTTGAGMGPSAGPTSRSDQNRGGGRGTSIPGKVERAVGDLVGSDSYGAQGAELAEAERLEREASMYRERAVGHGAHAHNKHGAGYSSGAGGGAGGMTGGRY
ncbi:hypothetical protein DXG03_003702 [Asterophora parasitica]|uniref:Uncharacterized protein n=1 Tax=Asterophora parasitica TaxID=117018 RepID=A0A9P7KEH1_9AGAR|nr:hypothetical protein DXG03_003702 [Asterophora parasitica]